MNCHLCRRILSLNLQTLLPKKVRNVGVNPVLPIVSSCVSRFSATAHTQSDAGKFLKGNVIDGKGIAADIKLDTKKETDAIMNLGIYSRRPHLTVVLVGEDPASCVYVRNKAKAATETGITSAIIRLQDTISEADLLKEIDNLNNDTNVDGILVQLPLPKHISERLVCDSVAVAKDVDGFNVLNVGKLCVGQEAFVPATPSGVLEMMKKLKIQTHGKNAVVIGRSKIVGLPLSLQFCSYGKGFEKLGDATTTICHSKTPKDELNAYCQGADILVAATGLPNLVTADMVKEGAVVIDVGINRITGANGKSRLVGDVDFPNVQKKAGMITPVPGGVGPLTIAMVIKNALTAYKRTFGIGEV